MELLVLGQIFPDILHPVHFRMGLLQAAQGLAGEMLGPGLGGEALQRNAQAADLVEALGRHQRQGDRAGGQHLQGSFGDEPAQRLAHRHRAGPQRRRHGADGDRGPGADRPGHDRLFQLEVGPVMQRLPFQLGDLEIGIGDAAHFHDVVTHGSFYPRPRLVQTADSLT